MTIETAAIFTVTCTGVMMLALAFYLIKAGWALPRPERQSHD